MKIKKCDGCAIPLCGIDVDWRWCDECKANKYSHFKDMAGKYCYNCSMSMNLSIYYACTCDERCNNMDTVKKYGLINAGIPQSATFTCEHHHVGTPKKFDGTVDDKIKAILYRYDPNNTRGVRFG